MNHTDNLRDICKQIGEAISLDVARDNPDEIMGKLGCLTNLLATSSHAVALAEMVYGQKLMELTESAQFKELTATEKKMIFAGKAKNEIYYVTLTERQNAALVHGIDALRSTLSFLKTEMSNLKN